MPSRLGKAAPTSLPDASLVGDMIQQDAARILELKQQIKALEEPDGAGRRELLHRRPEAPPSRAMAPSARPNSPVKSEPSSVFRNEASLALYLGMATLDNSIRQVPRRKADKACQRP